MLPNMDGWELLGRLKAAPALAGVPVVIISIVADRSKGLALGAAAVMQKPMSRRELSASIVELDIFPPALMTKLSVLLVHDDPIAMELLATRILSAVGGGGTVQRAYNGHEAIDSVRRERPDLIILNLVTPDVGGFDVVTTLHEHPDTAQIPILVVTAKQLTDEGRARLEGCPATIVESETFDRNLFAKEVRRVMSARQAVA